MRQRLPRAVFHTVPRGGRLAPLERPAEVADVIVAFLEGQRRSARAQGAGGR